LFQFVNTYCVGLTPCVAVVLRVCEDPGIQEKKTGVVYDALSTVTLSPVGDEVTTTGTPPLRFTVVELLAATVAPVTTILFDSKADACRLYVPGGVTQRL
jgi:hypothetical protein